MDMMQILFVCLLSGLLGAAELISRYRDQPMAVARLPASYAYVAFNMLVGIAALYTIHIMQPPGLTDVRPANAEEQARVAFLQVLTAGLGGAAFFRASIAKTKVGDLEIGVGPSFVIDAFLGATDRAIDRRRARDRADLIPLLMRGVPSDFAALELTDFCLSAMQNLPAAEEKTLKTRVASYASASDTDEDVRSMLIGFAISEYVGTNVLVSSKEKLKAEIDRAYAIREERLKGAVGTDRSTILAKVQQVRGTAKPAVVETPKAEER